MNTTVTLYGKTVCVELSAGAERALARRTAPLYAEVQLIFGCMIAKRVWFREEANENAVRVTPNLYVWFRPARYQKACSFDDIDGGVRGARFGLLVDIGFGLPVEAEVRACVEAAARVIAGLGGIVELMAPIFDDDPEPHFDRMLQTVAEIRRS